MGTENVSEVKSPEEFKRLSTLGMLDNERREEVKEDINNLIEKFVDNLVVFGDSQANNLLKEKLREQLDLFHVEIERVAGENDDLEFQAKCVEIENKLNNQDSGLNQLLRFVLFLKDEKVRYEKSVNNLAERVGRLKKHYDDIKERIENKEIPKDAKNRGKRDKAKDQYEGENRELAALRSNSPLLVYTELLKEFDGDVAVFFSQNEIDEVAFSKKTEEVQKLRENYLEIPEDSDVFEDGLSSKDMAKDIYVKELERLNTLKRNLPKLLNDIFTKLGKVDSDEAQMTLRNALDYKIRIPKVKTLEEMMADLEKVKTELEKKQNSEKILFLGMSQTQIKIFLVMLPFLVLGGWEGYKHFQKPKQNNNKPSRSEKFRPDEPVRFFSDGKVIDNQKSLDGFLNMEANDEIIYAKKADYPLLSPSEFGILVETASKHQLSQQNADYFFSSFEKLRSLPLPSIDLERINQEDGNGNFFHHLILPESVPLFDARFIKSFDLFVSLYNEKLGLMSYSREYSLLGESLIFMTGHQLSLEDCSNISFKYALQFQFSNGKRIAIKRVEQ